MSALPSAMHMLRTDSLVHMKSHMPGIAWPAVPDAGAARLMALQLQLQQSEQLPEGQLLALQLQQAQELLRYAVSAVPYYRERFADGVSDLTKPLTMDAWRQLPVLRRQDIQEAGKRLLSQQYPAAHGKLNRIATSGSTGRPIVAYTTEINGLLWQALTLRDHLWHGRDFAGRLAAIRYTESERGKYPDGAQRHGWGPATDAVFETGRSSLLNVQATVAQQAEWLLRQEADYLISYPSNLMALAGYCRTEGIVLPKLREVRTVGEVVTLELRQLIAEVWGVSVIDAYSAQEMGYLALQCPEHSHYHVQSENVLLEILNESGQVCGPGEKGRVVVTDLHNFAMPLIRYELGDYAQVGEQCDCGRTLPVLAQVLGRTRNMLLLPTGERRWPLIGSLIPELDQLPKVRQYQLVQKSLQSIEARIAVAEKLSAEQEQILVRMWQESLGYPFDISIIYQASIARGPGGKFEEFRSEVE